MGALIRTVFITKFTKKQLKRYSHDPYSRHNAGKGADEAEHQPESSPFDAKNALVEIVALDGTVGH